MSNLYLLIVKYKNIFNSQIKKCILFTSFDVAYDYGKNLDSTFKKEIFSKEEVNKNKIVWLANLSSFPKIVCKLYPIPQDLISTFYSSKSEHDDKYLIYYLYKHLKLNKII